jgi:hypothetical protein
MVALPDKPMQTVTAIYAAYEARQESGYRRHLGGSAIGKECERALWYSFRWTTKRAFTGRMLRLFETGHMAEARFVSNLRDTGATVLDVDPETGKQFTVTDETGHAGGSFDARILGLLEAPKTWHIGEFKTHKDDLFKKLLKSGLETAHYSHWAQMQFYMHLAGIDRGFYLAVNKDTDDLYQERVEVDPGAGARLLAKAARVIYLPRAPERITENAQWYACKICDHYGTCFEGSRPERHCRSCLHSSPVPGGAWECSKHHCEIPLDCAPLGCEDHLYIPDFINGEVLDANEKDGWVKYKMPDGSTFLDGPIPF